MVVCFVILSRLSLLFPEVDLKSSSFFLFFANKIFHLLICKKKKSKIFLFDNNYIKNYNYYLILAEMGPMGYQQATRVLNYLKRIAVCYRIKETLT